MEFAEMRGDGVGAGWLDDVLQLVSNEMREVLGAQRCSLQPFDSENNLFVGTKAGVSVAVEGAYGNWRGPRNRVMAWPAYDASTAPLRRGEVVYLSSDKDAGLERSYEGFYAGASTVGVPVMYRGDLVAVALATVYDPGHRFDPALVEAACHLANVAAVAIVCANEVREVRRAAEEQKTSFSSSLADLLASVEGSARGSRGCGRGARVSDPVVLGGNMRPAVASAFGAAGAASTGLALKSQALVASGVIAAPFTERELEILGFMSNGLTNRQIGDELFLSVNTVKGHVQSILGKLEVKNRSLAVLKAREIGLV